MHVMTIMSPSTCSKGTSLHAVTFMLREVDLLSDVKCGPELARVVQHSPFQFYAFVCTVQVISVP